MNLGFYGHTNTIVFTITKDGKFARQAILGGIRLLHHSAKESYEAKETRMENISIDHNSSKYRRDYYGVRLCEDANKQRYYGISQAFGYEDGDSPDNIFSDIPGTPVDMLAVWDEGYGNLDIPEAKNVFWASDKALPDRQQFSKIADRCFLFLNGKVLRNAGAMISRQISWERTASELMVEISSNPAISYLLQARCILISFGLDGAVFIVPDDEQHEDETQHKASLLLTHGDIEGAIGNKYPGHASDAFVFTAMAASFFSTIASFSAHVDSGTLPKWDDNNLITDFLNTLTNLLSQSRPPSAMTSSNAENDAVKWGSTLRVILEAGETIAPALIRIGAGGLFDDGDEGPHSTITTTLRHWAAFPIPLIPSVMGDEYKVPDSWTVINSVGGRQIFDVAYEYVQKGAVAIEGLPQLKLGALTTVDRWEIESYQNIRNLILDYASAESVRPLSIAVFGSPGSGKSFGVTQIAMNVLPGKIEKLEFNVSQFVSPMDLGVAFQQVRDVILEGKLPLVFFDEFDSDKDGMALGWVKSFLMPMQDGRFRDESGVHPLGKCILVFAGGTAASFEDFVAPMKDKFILSYVDRMSEEERYRSTNEQIEKEAQTYKVFKNIKGPDFVSRLRGTISVLGPNPKDSSDQNHILRRALLLRSLCERDRRLATKGNADTAPNSMPISPGIIRAMLTVPEFRHGARSMEAILDMSRIEGGVWEPAALPFRSQLALHVDADAFVNLMANV